jgi:N-hydroxyarylamine O-acetyltransferase
MSIIDLEAYLCRIGYEEGREPNLATLNALHRRHASTIPYENIDPFLSRQVSLDLTSIHQKLIAHRRGGYCFEQNTIFKAALEALGFDIVGLIARVTLFPSPDGLPPPPTHMVIQVTLPEGTFIADVGFGGFSMMYPLRLVPDVEQTIGDAVYRIRFSNGAHDVEVRTNSEWRPCYRFTLQPAFANDYLVSNWYTATFPDSFFRHNLMAERLTDEVRYFLLNRRLTQRHADGRVEEQVIDSAEAMSRVLDEALAIDPSVTNVPMLFAKLPRDS